MAFIITTTVSLPGGVLVIPEFGNRTYTHPLVSYDLETEFDEDEIRISTTIQNAIDNGWITVVDGDGENITDISVLQFNTDTIDISSITLDGYTSGAGVITATDSILSAIEKLNGNTVALVTGVSSVNSLTGAVALTGTSDRITISGANVFDIASTYVGQSSITTLGTITTGVWNGTAIANANLANSSITINGTSTSLGGSVTITTTGTTNRITVTGGTGLTPTIDISATYVGQTSITTLGTITSGTWNGTTIAIANGGTSATTANAALNNLLPSQAGNNAKVLSTDGTNSSWILVSVAGVNGGTVTSIDGSGGTTGLTLTGGPITVNGTLTLGGTLAIANGGTGQTTALAAFNTLSPLTTKGDLLTRNTTDNIRVPVGTNGQVLIADSAQASGVRWGNASDISGQTIRFLNTNTGNSETVVNTTTETDFTSNGTNYSMPANTVKANSLIRFLVYGRFSTKAGSVGTLTIRLKIGSTIYATSIISPGSAVTDQGFQFTGQMQFRTIGVSGTVYSHLLCVFDGAGASGATTFVDSSNGTAVVDTTVSNTIQMSAQWSNANADNSITIEQATFEILN